jgi:hypothetical protein
MRSHTAEKGKGEGLRMNPKYHYLPVSVYQLEQAGWLIGGGLYLFIDVPLLLLCIHDVLTVSLHKTASCLNRNTNTVV